MQRIIFVGGGNMAGAVISGLLKQGHAAAALHVIDPDADKRGKLRSEFGVSSQAATDSSLAGADLVVWAVKPQVFAAAARDCCEHIGAALQLSVMAGIRIAAIARALDTTRVVRAMPNTPALIGRGIAALYAPAAVTAAERALTEQVLGATGVTLWVQAEGDLDAVTALSGSGPAYVFYFIEAMVQAATEMGLSGDVGRKLALATFSGATALAQASPETPATLRERVTSRGGTTHAALLCLEAHGVKSAFVAALKAAQQRAKELGDQFGGDSPVV
ncbi:MAG: pyrroline-5-carboxylate reductase [Burkholderiaceae bacterium]